MVKRIVPVLAMLGVFGVAGAAPKKNASGSKLDTARIEELTGVKGALN